MIKEELIEKLANINFTGHPGFYDLLVRMAEIYSSKNNDYSGGKPLGNFMDCQRAGIDPVDGLLTRIGDKISRIFELNKKRKTGEKQRVLDEKLEDTLIDASNYCLITILVLGDLENKT